MLVVEEEEGVAK